MTVTDTYVLEPSAEELDRLIFTSRFLAPVVEDSCRRAGLREGGYAIDAGCGPLGALPTIAGIVGRKGRVLGVDADQGALMRARQGLDRLGITCVELAQADVNDLTPDVAGSGADLVFCRLVLMHQADPEATMRRLGELLRPGGVLIAMDFFAAPVCDPPHPSVDRAWELTIEAMRLRGAHPETSRRYRDHCEAAGLELVSERGQFFPMPAAVVVTEAATLLRGSRATLEGAGHCTAQEIDDVLDALRPEDLPFGATAYSPVTVELVARRPVS